MVLLRTDDEQVDDTRLTRNCLSTAQTRLVRPEAQVCGEGYHGYYRRRVWFSCTDLADLLPSTTHQAPPLLSSSADERLRIEPQPVRADKHLFHRRHRTSSSARLHPARLPHVQGCQWRFTCPWMDDRLGFHCWFRPIECKDVVQLASIPICFPSCRTTRHVRTCRTIRNYATCKRIECDRAEDDTRSFRLQVSCGSPQCVRRKAVQCPWWWTFRKRVCRNTCDGETKQRISNAREA